MRMMLSGLIVYGTFLSGAAHAQEATLESSPPVVVKTSPEAGSGEIDPSTTEIRVTFSKEMQDGNWSWVTESKDSYPGLPGGALTRFSHPPGHRERHRPGYIDERSEEHEPEEPQVHREGTEQCDRWRQRFPSRPPQDPGDQGDERAKDQEPIMPGLDPGEQWRHDGRRLTSPQSRRDEYAVNLRV